MNYRNKMSVCVCSRNLFVAATTAVALVRTAEYKWSRSPQLPLLFHNTRARKLFQNDLVPSFMLDDKKQK